MVLMQHECTLHGPFTFYYAFRWPSSFADRIRDRWKEARGTEQREFRPIRSTSVDLVPLEN